MNEISLIIVFVYGASLESLTQWNMENDLTRQWAAVYTSRLTLHESIFYLSSFFHLWFMPFDAFIY